jgi:two-component system, chemotaxis family, chemotaxis protein CheY
MKILITDDSKAMRMIVIRTMRQAGFDDHTFVEAEDGAQALAAIKADPPDLVLSDWNMPNMTGIELLETLRSEGIDVPLGFVTSETTPEMRERAVAAGAMFLLAKPFTVDTFSEVLSGVGV